jgi:putative endonuclease
LRVEGSGAWSVYIIRCGDGTLYTGITTNLERRLKMHAAGRGARYTRGRGPFRVLRVETGFRRGDALRRELALKRMTRAAKLRLRNSQPSTLNPQPVTAAARRP